MNGNGDKILSGLNAACISTLFLTAHIVLPPSAFSWTNEIDFVAGSTNGIASVDVISSDAFGSELATFSAICTNEIIGRSIAIIDSYRKICLFEQSIEPKWLLESMAISSNVVASTVNSPETWHYWASRLLLSGGLALSADNFASYAIMTNAVQPGYSHQADIAGTNLIMRALLDAFDTPDLSGAEAFAAHAGIAAAVCGLSTAASNSVQTLPPRYKAMVDEILETKRGDRPVINEVR